jgi:IS30 family transposase
MTKTRAQRQREKRLEEILRLHQRGSSLRRIAGYLGVSHTTVRRDLERWRESQNVEHLPVTNVPASGTFLAPECSSNVVPIRRREAS